MLTSDVGLQTNLNPTDRRGETRLYINGEIWDNYSSSRVVEFTEQAGGSRLEFTSRGPLRHMLGRQVELWAGTEEGFEPLFTGRLKRPMPTPATFTSAAVAVGPFAQMADQSFTEPVSYATVYVYDALKDICSRAGYSQGVPIIRAPKILRDDPEDEEFFRTKIKEMLFSEDAKLLEGAGQICESADLVMTDTGNGNRLFIPRPHPGGGTNTRELFTESEYKTFEVEEEYPTTFDRVVVSRQSSDTNAENVYEVRAVQPVTQPYDGVPAPKNRVLYVTDFAGDQQEANRTAYDLARRVGLHGQIKWTMTELPLVPVTRYSSLQGARDVEEPDGWYRELYDLTMHEGVTYDPTAWTMDIGGEGMLLEKTKIAPLRIVVDPPPSAAVLRS